MVLPYSILEFWILDDFGYEPNRSSPAQMMMLQIFDEILLYTVQENLIFECTQHPYKTHGTRNVCLSAELTSLEVPNSSLLNCFIVLSLSSL